MNDDCPVCEGERYVKRRTADGGLMIMPCPKCAERDANHRLNVPPPSHDELWDRFGAAKQTIDALLAYRDDAFPERACDRCGKPYRGPAVYCSLDCAIQDA